ncbi:MAG: type II secretion system protein GspG [Planctomycetes bacterium]|nr:type II secretion system protein GspG [Planctomycetota bacterium]
MLVVIVGGWWHVRRQESRKRGCLFQFAMIRTSLVMYETTYGTYPPPPNAAVVAALRGPGSPEFDFLGPCDMSATGEYVDPWGRPFVFRPYGPGAAPEKGPPYRIYSVGPNGKDELGGGDDISPSR